MGQGHQDHPGMATIPFESRTGSPGPQMPRATPGQPHAFAGGHPSVAVKDLPSRRYLIRCRPVHRVVCGSRRYRRRTPGRAAATARAGYRRQANEAGMPRLADGIHELARQAGWHPVGSRPPSEPRKEDPPSEPRKEERSPGSPAGGDIRRTRPVRRPSRRGASAVIIFRPGSDHLSAEHVLTSEAELSPAARRFRPRHRDRRRATG